MLEDKFYFGKNWVIFFKFSFFTVTGKILKLNLQQMRPFNNHKLAE
jgi:hypothetical protein